MHNKDDERKAGMTDLEKEELKNVTGGIWGLPDMTNLLRPNIPTLTQCGTSNMYCQTCGHITSHQMNFAGDWVCNICGTIGGD